MASLENHKIKDGMLIGTISLGLAHCKVTFEICSVAEWKTLSKDEAEKMAIDALWESGKIDWWY